MAIEVRCGHCQKLLRVKTELAGKRGKCPACGQPLTVPPLQSLLPESESADALLPPGNPPAAAQNQNELWQWIQSPEAAIPPVKQDLGDESVPVGATQDVKLPKLQRRGGTKAKPSSARRKGPSFSSLARTFPLLRFAIPVAIIGALIAGALYWFGSFDSNFRIADIHRVESYVAYHLGYQELGPVIGGADRLCILRNSDEGEFLLIRVVIRQSWITEKRPPQIIDAMSLKDEDFTLQIGNTQEHPLLVVDELPKEPRTVEYNFSRRISPEEAIPHADDSWSQKGAVDLGDAQVQMGIGGVQSCSGKAIYTSAKGMRVQFDFSGHSVAVSWESDSRAMVGSNRWEASGNMFAVNTELDCLFRRPAQKGPATLSLFGQSVPLPNVP